MSVRRFLLLSLVAVSCVGCIRIEETIVLQPDGSGSARVEIAIPQAGLRWLPGKPTGAWLQGGLPDGVRLKSFVNSQKKTKITDANGKEHELASEQFDFDLVFESVAALNDIRVRPDTRNMMAAAAGGTPGKLVSGNMAAVKNATPTVGPFQKITLVEDGDVLRFRRVVQAARTPDEMAADKMNVPGSAARPQAIKLGNSVLKISIVCPGDVLEHNAHQVEGRTLIWEFKLQELQERLDRDWTVEFKCRREEKE
jgi:hypothetical protein